MANKISIIEVTNGYIVRIDEACPFDGSIEKTDEVYLELAEVFERVRRVCTKGSQTLMSVDRNNR